jgi:hypothetical protein
MSLIEDGDIPKEFAAALGEVKREYGIPAALPLHPGGGIPRILVSAALGVPSLVGMVVALAAKGNICPEDFSVRPIGKRCLLSSLIAERPLAMGNTDARCIEVAFIASWKLVGLNAAMKRAPINPIFRDMIRDLVNVAVAYVTAYDLGNVDEVPPRYFDHFKPLRYVLHAK